MNDEVEIRRNVTKLHFECFKMQADWNQTKSTKANVKKLNIMLFIDLLLAFTFDIYYMYEYPFIVCNLVL